MSEAEVTPENAQGLYAEGRITVNQARGAYGFPPFEGADGDIGSFRLMPAPAAPRPLVVEVEWEQDGESRREIYGPWTPAEDDSHLEGISRFVKGWPARTGITPAEVRLTLCLDPDERPAGA